MKGVSEVCLYRQISCDPLCCAWPAIVVAQAVPVHHAGIGMEYHVMACRTGGEWGQGLRSMVGSSDEQAALRAIESLSVSYDVDELL